MSRLVGAEEFDDFETIIVDDDSDDETVSLASDYSSRLRLKIVRNGSNNIPRGRNIGLGAGKSDLVAFLDSDDFAAQDWTQIIAKTFDEQPDFGLDPPAILFLPTDQRYRRRWHQ